MKNTFQWTPILLFFASMLVCIGCKPAIISENPKKPACDCTIYPFPNGCDSQCGIADGVVESVGKDSVTVKMQARPGQPAELKTIPLSNLKLPPESLRTGASVRLIYEKSATEPSTIKPNAVRSVVTRKP